MRKSEKREKNGEPRFSKKKVERDDDLENDVDALFRLPLPEFTGARNTLAVRLKKSGRGDEAVRVKALVKPSVSAWAVNLLYWNHREAFDRLLASGERFHKAQASGKAADMRGALDARHLALADLSDLATTLLRDADHNPAPDTTHRIRTTLEAISAYASRSDAPLPGRLTHDVDPPGFELFASSTIGAGLALVKERAARVTPSQESSSAATKTRPKVAADEDAHQLEETRKTKIAAARVSLQDAKRSLSQARARAQSSEAAQKKAHAKATEAEKQRRHAEERLEKARADSEDAARRAQKIAVEVEEATREVKDAERTVEKTSKELEKLFGEHSGR